MFHIQSYKFTDADLNILWCLFLTQAIILPAVAERYRRMPTVAAFSCSKNISALYNDRLVTVSLRTDCALPIACFPQNKSFE